MCTNIWNGYKFQKDCV